MLVVLLIVTLTALLLALSSAGFGALFWTDLARKLLFLVWMGLAGAALLCACAADIAAQSAARGSVLVLGALALLIAVLSASARLDPRQPVAQPRRPAGHGRPATSWLFLLRNVLIGLIVTGLALRYFYVSQQWRLNVESQARARVNALQARIRPHFLYNSMNTIASLTRSDPARAEEAVQDLADLFRANLNEKRSLITLKEELEAARIYQRIEQLRMGDRLTRALGCEGPAHARAGSGAHRAAAARERHRARRREPGRRRRGHRRGQRAPMASSCCACAIRCRWTRRHAAAATASRSTTSANVSRCCMAQGRR